MALPDLDDQSLELILRLQMEDLQFITTTNDNGQDDADRKTALATFKSDIEAFELHRALCQHVANGGEPEEYVPPDLNPTINDAYSSSSWETLTGTEVSASEASHASRAPVGSLEDEQREALRKLDQLVVNEEEDIYSPRRDEQVPATTAGSEETRSLSRGCRDSGEANTNEDQDEPLSDRDHEVVCEACGITRRMGFVWFAESPCGHQYCEECLTQLVSYSITDESLFPPRCCQQPIPIKDHDFLPPELVQRFEAKEIEYNTTDRTYCHRPECSTFIPILVDEGTVQCPDCNEITCTSCKGSAHEGKDCPDDTATKEVLRVAKEQGWQRCYSCHRVVELNTGCNHITCRCRAQFCYLCGKQWKSCGCEHVTQRYLWARAEAIIDRNIAGARGRGPRVGANERREAVQREMRNQRRNHACQHIGWWEHRRGQYQCEVCRDTLPDFIFECPDCHMHACYKCKMHRL